MEVSLENLASATAVSKSFGRFLSRSKKEPVFILRNNEVEAVLVGIKHYRRLAEAYEVLQDLSLAREVFEQPTDNPEGKTVFDILEEFEE
ncbi:MAG: type II toxin-antitoxin system Phd/YefM family antitoxin [Moorellales bacterium]